MKLSVSQDKLARSLAVVGRAVATRSTLPITTHVLLRASDSFLELSATNLEISISCKIDAEVQTQGSIAVPARLLTEFVTSLQPDLMSMELSNSTKQLEVSSGRVTAKLTGQSADDFPVTHSQVISPSQSNVRVLIILALLNNKMYKSYYHNYL